MDLVERFLKLWLCILADKYFKLGYSLLDSIRQYWATKKCQVTSW